MSLKQSELSKSEIASDNNGQSPVEQKIVNFSPLAKKVLLSHFNLP